MSPKKSSSGIPSTFRRLSLSLPLSLSFSRSLSLRTPMGIPSTFLTTYCVLLTIYYLLRAAYYLLLITYL